MEFLPEFFLDERGIIALVFTVVAAIVSAKLETKKETKEDSELILKAFDEIKKTVDVLRCQNEELKKDYKLLRDELEDYRHKYYKQIEINNSQSAQLTKLNLEMIYLVDKK